MGKCVFRDGVIVEDYGKPYVVAEVNSSHNGNIETAKLMIDAAKAAGCSCVKFQSWSSDSLYSASYYQGNPIFKRIVDKLALNKEQLKMMSHYCMKKEIAFSSTPYSKEEVDFLIEECNVPFIKISSMELNNYDFLSYIGKTGVPIVLSTGMGELDEIKKAVKVLEDTKNSNICLLHCISIYPAKVAAIQLNNILGLRQIFPRYPIGFSDHTIGIEIAGAAVALGAAVIEKHLTLDDKKIGMDNQMATLPEKMTELVFNCENVNVALGGFERQLSPEERNQRIKMRRSMVTTRSLSAGMVLCREDLYAKRPGTGISPDRIESLLGRVLSRNVEADTIINEDDLV